jgi:hypothetical protein
MLQQHWPGDAFVGSVGQPSTQSATVSPSVSVSGLKQPHWPGLFFAGSVGQPSQRSGVPSASVSGPAPGHSAHAAKSATIAMW